MGNKSGAPVGYSSYGSKESAFITACKRNTVPYIKKYIQDLDIKDLVKGISILIDNKEWDTLVEIMDVNKARSLVYEALPLEPFKKVILTAKWNVWSVINSVKDDKDKLFI